MRPFPRDLGTNTGISALSQEGGAASLSPNKDSGLTVATGGVPRNEEPSSHAKPTPPFLSRRYRISVLDNPFTDVILIAPGVPTIGIIAELRSPQTGRLLYAILCAATSDWRPYRCGTSRSRGHRSRSTQHPRGGSKHIESFAKCEPARSFFHSRSSVAAGAPVTAGPRVAAGAPVTSGPRIAAGPRVAARAPVTTRPSVAARPSVTAASPVGLVRSTAVD